MALAKFVAHLVNQQVAHELLALQLLSLLFARPTADSVEIAIGFTKECGQMLQEVSPSGMNSVFERFRGILHSGQLDKRVQFMIEALFKCRKNGFGDFPRVLPELDLVESEEQITHEVGLEDALDKEDALDVFAVDAAFDTNERLWRSIQAEILGGSDGEEEEDEDAEVVHAAAAAGGADSPAGGAAAAHGSAGGSGYQPPAAAQQAVVNDVSIDIPGLRRTIYLVIMSSLDFEECAHKLMGLNIPPQHAVEICNMIVECCAQERTYLKMFGLLGQRFCMMRGPWRELFEEVFAHQYSTVHSLETNKLRNVAKFFAHLLATDALPWTVFEFVRLSESETTSSSRIFLKVLLQELMQSVGMQTLRSRLHEPDMQAMFSGMLPKDNPRDTRFAINFYTTIGLGALTDGLREHLQTAAVAAAAAAQRQRSYSRSSSSSGSYSSRSSRSYSSHSSRSYSSRSRSRSRSYSSRSYSSRSRSRSRSYSSRSSRRSRSYSLGHKRRSLSRSPSHRRADPPASLPAAS